ncbi:LAMI_0F11364g1_1 [Lachancea mirantina]|uniref:LAMI_0F11364g1_1 n=1 Tax=Lachancea mirantina TaxID=1230905 RepID=A0A1G4K2M7_9SACH|nr:LAMI_0F11364g1_1 [Lachancea mirantina]
MSASSINRSLTTIRTELEFLKESNVLSEETYQEIMGSLPEKADSSRSGGQNNAPNGAEFVEAIYAFRAQQDGDLDLQPGDKVQVLEKPSREWFKGSCNGRVGMFPSNYVKPAFSGGSVVGSDRSNLPPPPQYQAQPNLQPQPTNNSYQSNSSQQPFPPPSTNYYQQPPQQYQQYQQPQFQQQPQYYQPQPQQPPQEPAQPAPQAQSHHGSDAFKRFGSKLGNAAIFGAGATMGSDLVNSIF